MALLVARFHDLDGLSAPHRFSGPFCSFHLAPLSNAHETVKNGDAIVGMTMRSFSGNRSFCRRTDKRQAALIQGFLALAC